MKKVKTDKKCPICKSSSFYFVEIWAGSTITWEVNNGCFNKDDGFLCAEDAAPKKVEGHCKCGHRWTVKNAVNIGDVYKTTDKEGEQL